jgi:hypothetical protein
MGLSNRGAQRIRAVPAGPIGISGAPGEATLRNAPEIC